MRITKTAYDSAFEKYQKEMGEDEQEREFILAHRGCDKCPCCGKPNPSSGENQQRYTYKQNHGIKVTYGKIDEYWCEECGSKWESDPFVTKTFFAEWFLFVTGILIIIGILIFHVWLAYFLILTLGNYGIGLAIGELIIFITLCATFYMEAEPYESQENSYRNILSEYPKRGFRSIVENKE